MIAKYVETELDRVNDKITALKKQLLSAPDGKLICGQSGKYCKWYQSDGHNKTYIPKSQRNLAEKLALKRYLSAEINDLINEKKALEAYLKIHRNAPKEAEQLLQSKPEYQKLLKSYFQPQNSIVESWQAESFEQNTAYPEQLNNPTASGNLVRSKSEMLIDLYLYKNKIPFRYECVLHLGEVTLFPDFTILHPLTHKIYYWEHFGLMDDSNYVKNACSKIQLYASHGIIPSIQLITTYETRDNPLNINVVENIIEQYFLK